MNSNNPLIRAWRQLFGLAFFMCTSLACQHFESKKTRMEKDLVKTQVKIIESKIDRGSIDAAWYDLEPLLRKHPDNVDLLTLAGFVHMGLKNEARSVTMMKEAFRLKPSPGAALNLSSAYIAVKRYDLAHRALDEGLQLHDASPYPHLGRLHHNRGYTYELQRRPRQAISAYKQALYHSPGYIPTLMSLAALHERLGDVKNAMIYYQRYAYACKSCFLPVRKLARHFVATGNVDTARKVVENYLRQPRLPKNEKDRGQMLLRSLYVSGVDASQKNPQQARLPSP